MDMQTPRLILRSLCEQDWKDMLDIMRDKEAAPMAQYDHPVPTNEADVRGVINHFVGGDRLLALWEKKAQRIIGYVALMGSEPGQRELGYCLHSAWQHLGYALEGCEAAVHYAFKTLDVERLISGTAAVNLPSNRLLSRLGFQKTGEETCAFRQTPEGKPFSFLGFTYRLTRAQWLAAHPSEAG